MTNKYRLAFVVALFTLINATVVLFLASLTPIAAAIISSLLWLLCSIALLWIFSHWH